MSPLLRIGRLEALEVETDVLSQDVVRIREGQRVEIYGPATGRQPGHGDCLLGREVNVSLFDAIKQPISRLKHSAEMHFRDQHTREKHGYENRSQTPSSLYVSRANACNAEVRAPVSTLALIQSMPMSGRLTHSRQPSVLTT